MLVSCFRRFSLLVGCFLVLLQLPSSAAADFPLIVGRSTTGTWKDDIDYEIFYYMTIKFADGPSNQVDCVLSRLTGLGGLFANATDSILEMTPAQAEQVEADHMAANPDYQDNIMGGFSMSISGRGPPSLNPSGAVAPTLGAGPAGPAVNEEDNAGNVSIPGLGTAESRQGGSIDRPAPTIQKEFHQTFDSSLGERGGLEYDTEINLGLYIQGLYLNRFEDIVDIVETDLDEQDVEDLEAFVREQARTLVIPDVVPDVPDDDMMIGAVPYFFQQPLDLHRGTFRWTLQTECRHNLSGELAGDNPSLENSIIIGRTIRGEFEGQTYEYSVFFEFYQLRGFETSEQESCFEEAVDSLFVTTPSIVEMTPDQIEFTRSMITEEHARPWNFTEMMNRGPLTPVFGGGAQVRIGMAGVTVGYEKGVMLTLGDEHIVFYEDYDTDPAGLMEFVKSIEDPVQEDLKSFFPVNGTAVLRQRWGMMFDMGISFKPMKDGLGIYPPLFVENLLYCKNATALEHMDPLFGRPQPVDEETEETGEVAEVPDTVMLPPSLGEVEGVEFVQPGDATDSVVSDANHVSVFMGGVSSIMLLLFV